MPNVNYNKRAQRIRRKLKQVNSERFRLTVFKSSRNISAQIIDDKSNKTLISESSIKDKNINDLKTLLANEATTLLHGKAAAIKASDTAKKTFAGGSGDELPVIQIKKDQVNDGLNIIDLSSKTNLFSSKSEIRRLIKGGAVKINNEIVPDDKMIIDQKYFQT